MLHPAASSPRRFSCVLVLVALVLLGPPTAPADDDIDRLMEQAARQQRELEALRSHVASQTQPDVEAQRVQNLRSLVREVLSEEEFALTPQTISAGYDRGFYVRSADEQFVLRIRGMLQFRWTHTGRTRPENSRRQDGSAADRSGFDFHRIRLTFSGQLYDEDLTYLVTLRADAAQAYDIDAFHAWINYRLIDEFQIRAGLFRLASTRSDFTSDALQAFPDRPIENDMFRLGEGLGVRLWGQLFQKRLEYYLDVVNSLNGTGNRTITPDPAEHDNNPALVARLVWHVLSKDPATDFASQSDIPRHDEPVFDLGMHYAFNEDASDRLTSRLVLPGPLGGFANTTSNGVQINQFGFDAAFKWRGVSLTAEYMLRIIDPRRAGRAPFTPWWLATGDDSTVAQHGGYMQAGWFLPIPGHEDRLELVARAGGISTLANRSEGLWEYGVGMNYYFRKHDAKLQADITKIHEAPLRSSGVGIPNINDDALIFRVQLQVAF